MCLRISLLLLLIGLPWYAPLAVSPGEQQNHGAGLWAPNQAMAGGWLPVAWSGPDKRGDRITVVAPQAGDDQLGRYALTRQGNPLVLPMPTIPGDYEIRYLAGSSRRLLARRGIRIIAGDALTD